MAAIMDVLAGVGIGVYTSDGTPILFGAERSAHDFWLYDFEVGVTAAAEGDGTTRTLDDTAASLAQAGITNSGQPVSVEDVRSAIHGSVAAAVADPADPRSFVLLVIRQLGMQATKPYDLATDVPADQISLSPLASFLVLADLTLPIVAAGPPIASASGQIASVKAVAGADPLTANACDQVATYAGQQTWNTGKQVATFVATVIQSGASSNAIAIQALEQALLTLAVKGVYRPMHDVHFAHSSAEVGTPKTSTDYYYRIWMAYDLPDSVIMCGALAGIALPQNAFKGPDAGLEGVPINWHKDQLARYGTVTCGAGGGTDCDHTDRFGVAEIHFQAFTEIPPAGVGPEKYDQIVLVPTADVGAGMAFSLVSLRFAASTLKISWHQAYDVYLEVNSTIDGTKVLGQARVFGSLRLSWLEDATDPAGGYWISYDPGLLDNYTTPGKLGCPPGLPVVEGRSTFHVFVNNASIPFDGKANGMSLKFYHDGLLQTPDEMTIPTCTSYPNVTAPAYFWSTMFGDQHKAEFDKTSKYFTVTDWTYVAPRMASWGDKVRIADYESRGSCDGQCREVTLLTIWLLLAPPDRQKP